MPDASSIRTEYETTNNNNTILNYDIKKMAIMQCVWVTLRSEQAKQEAEKQLTNVASA